MSRQIGSLHRSISHPANLQNPVPIIPLFAFPPPESPHINTSSGMDSDANSDITVFNTISQFNNSDIETQTNLPTLNPTHQHFLNPPFDPFTPNPKIIPPLPSLIFTKQPRQTPPLPMNVPTTIPQKPRKSHMN